MLIQTFIHQTRAKHASIKYDGCGFLRIELDDDVELEIEDILEQRKIAAELTQGVAHVVLAIAGNRTSATKEARIYSSKNIPEGRLAEAIIVKSLPVRLMGKIYIGFHKPNVPTKMFEKEKDALEWLNKMLHCE